MLAVRSIFDIARNSTGGDRTFAVAARLFTFYAPKLTPEYIAVDRHLVQPVSQTRMISDGEAREAAKPQGASASAQKGTGSG